LWVGLVIVEDHQVAMVTEFVRTAR